MTIAPSQQPQPTQSQSVQPQSTEAEQPQLAQWRPATWEEFVAIADAPENEKAKFYYFNHKMLVEDMGVGPDHAVDNGLIHTAIILYCTLKLIACRGLVNATYRRTEAREAQPDSSFYFQEKVNEVPQGNKVIDLDSHPSPDLVVEVSATSLSEDLGTKRLLYEELGVKEYWVVDIENSQIVAFEIYDRGSKRITTSMVLPGLEMSLLEQALCDRKTQDDSQIMATMMQQFQG